jgi:sugar lactone lactonase YvrE
MRIGEGSFRYEWIEHWVRLPDTETGRSNGRTHGVAVLGCGDVLVFNQAQPAVLRYSSDGRLINAWGDRFHGAHGLTLVREGDQEYLWLADEKSCEVVKTTLDGTPLLRLHRPDHPAYQAGQRYVPTWVAVNEQRFGGNGDVWVADGYGSSQVHRYDKAGAYVGTINGTEGRAGAFNSPHGIMFRPGASGPELYIADRANRRIQVYDPEGRFKRVISGVCHSPCGFWFANGLTYIPELFTGIKILDEQDRLAACLGDSDRVGPAGDGAWWPPRCPQGWPNLAGTEHVQPGRFNSPHGIAAAPNGDIYIVEWIVGGRITKLARC